MSARSALAALVGAQINQVQFSPETGLLALSTWNEGERILGFAIGPVLGGLGLLPRMPKVKAPATHQVVAALRAHLAEQKLLEVLVQSDGVVRLAVGASATPTALEVLPGRRGWLRLCTADGREVLRWGAEKDTVPFVLEDSIDLKSKGEKLLERSEQAGLERAKQTLTKAVRSKVQATERRQEAIEKDLARLGDIPRLQKVGTLLVAQAAKIPKGAARAVLDDWEGGTMEISLDPARPARAQAEDFFHKARRYQRGERVMRKRLEDAQRILDALKPLLDALQKAPLEVAALDALSQQARAQGIREALPVREVAAGIKKTEPRKPYVRYRSAAGNSILVGRGAADNDAVTTKHARPHDLWMHAKDFTGAHVIVPLEKGKSCPAEVLLDAATLAAHFSDGRGEGVVDVAYVERRYVRKPKGSAPGFVVYQREKVLPLRMQQERLERLLDARED